MTTFLSDTALPQDAGPSGQPVERKAQVTCVSCRGTGRIPESWLAYTKDLRCHACQETGLMPDSWVGPVDIGELPGGEGQMAEAHQGYPCPTGIGDVCEECA